MTDQKNKKRENGRDWAQILSLLPVQIMILDPDGRILYVNRTFSGAKGEEVENTNVFDHIPQKDKKKFRKLMDSVLESGKAKKVEIPIVFSDWPQKWLLCHIMPIKRNGRSKELALVTQDITEKKAAEDGLRQSEHKFRTLAEQSPNMIFIHCKGRIVYVNPWCEKIMGFSRQEMYSEGFDFFELIAPESVEAIQENFALYMQKKEVPPFEYTLVTKDGEKLDVILTTKLCSYENENAIFGIATDITEHIKTEKALKRGKDNLEHRVKERTEELTEANKRLELQIDQLIKTESALRTNKARLRSIFDSSPNAITVTDTSANIIECNREALVQSRFATKQELCKKNALDLFVDEDVPRAMRNMEITLQKGIIRNIEYTLLRKDGTEYPVNASVSVVKDARGQVSGFVAVTTDITERKKSEEALLESQSQLHEQKKALEQKNITLGEIIAQSEIDKLKIKEDITLNVRRVLFPILDRLVLDSGPSLLLDLLRHQLERVTSTYGAKISEKSANLTTREIEICHMIKGGFSSKDISHLLHITTSTVDRHRKNIRRKLQLTNKSINLETYLKTMD